MIKTNNNFDKKAVAPEPSVSNLWKSSVKQETSKQVKPNKYLKTSLIDKNTATNDFTITHYDSRSQDASPWLGRFNLLQAFPAMSAKSAEDVLYVL